MSAAEAGVDAKLGRLVSARIRRAQQLHAGLVLVVPALSVPAVLYEIASERVRVWHLVMLTVGYLVTMLGITVGFHRLLTHRSFKAPAAIHAALAIAGSMAAQGPPMYWVSNHRLHHQRSDKDGDPHSPHVANNRPIQGWRGLWHAHAGWAFDHELANPLLLARDLLRSQLMRWVNQRYLLWVALGLLLPAALGAFLVGTARGTYEGLLWGGLVRLFLNFHVTCSINSITHKFGQRPFATKDHSRNNAWLAIPTLGEAWHNNHHAFPNSAWLGLRAREVDIGGWTIQLLSWCGLARDVVRPDARTVREATQRERG